MTKRPDHPNPFPFIDSLTKSQSILGWCYLPIHVFALPFILPALAEYGELPLSSGQVTAVYYAAGALFVLVFFRTYLRRCFDTLCDRLPYCALALVMTFFTYYVLSYAAALILVIAEGGVAENPNNEAVAAAADSDFGIVRAVTVFIAPLVEEVLFRGVAFGSLRKYSRFSAYVISTALFCIYHIWQYPIVTGDWTLLIYGIQYVPPGIVLARAYERTGSIWTPIFFHIGVNAFSFWYLTQV